jgi:sugar-specific transcriptional regulator TrmB
VYNYIESLSRKGIITMVIDNYTKKYLVIEPDQIENLLIGRRQQSIQKTSELLKQIQNTKDQSNEITITKGLDKLKKVYEKILLSKNKSQYMVKGGDYQSWVNLNKEFFGNFMIRRGVEFSSIRCLFNPTQSIPRSSLKPNSNNTIIKILPTKTTISTNMILVDSTIIVHELEPPYQCIIIKNDFLFAMEKQEFEILWGLL